MLLWSMDNEEFFSEEFYRIGFGEAVNLGLLTDYKVLVLTLSEEDLSEDMKAKVKGNDELTLDDASKLVGCVNALSKRIKGDKGITAKEDPGIYPASVRSTVSRLPFRHQQHREPEHAAHAGYAGKRRGGQRNIDTRRFLPKRAPVCGKDRQPGRKASHHQDALRKVLQGGVPKDGR